MDLLHRGLSHALNNNYIDETHRSSARRDKKGSVGKLPTARLNPRRIEVQCTCPTDDNEDKNNSKGGEKMKFIDNCLKLMVCLTAFMYALAAVLHQVVLLIK